MNEEEIKAIEYFKDDISYLEEEFKRPNFEGRYITIRSAELEKLRVLLNLIEKQKAEIEKKDKIIEEMAIYLADIDFDECCAEIPEPCLSCSWEDYEPHTNCIKEYFENKVKESK